MCSKRILTNAIRKLKTHKRGITLLETLLALAVGAIVIIASIQGANRYTESVQVQASASQLGRLILALDTWANDHYQEATAEAPRIYTPAETQGILIPYLGSSFPVDAFRNQYRIATRTYTYRVPDPANPGNDIDRDAIQFLLIGFNPNPGVIGTNDTIRINIANTAGSRAGYISTAQASCPDGSGGTLPPGNICGAFGSFALLGSQFPNGALNNAFVVGLVTKGDSSFYGDQLYRYNYTDPELNTMRTTMFMDSPTDPNEIQSPNQPMVLSATTPLGGTASVQINDTTAGNLGGVVVSPGTSNRTTFVGEGGDDPILRSSTSVMQVGQGNERLRLGDIVSQTLTRPNATVTAPIEMGTGDIAGDTYFANLVRTEEISSLFRDPTAPLRIQNFNRGEVIIGQRARYRPAASGTLNNTDYELSSGRLIAGHVVSQDITCADCGGSLSQILPRWRHMGTYFVAYTSNTGTLVPKPSCTNNRRNALNRPSSSEEPNFAENAVDERYVPRIILVPRQIASKSASQWRRPDGSVLAGQNISDVPIDSHLRAINQSATAWRVLLHKPGDNVYTTAFAMTYCVFTGGDANEQDPSSTFLPGMLESTPAGVGAWNPLP